MSKELYACIECGFETPKWMGRCTRCGNWGSLKKFTKKKNISKVTKKVGNIKIEKIASFENKEDTRVSTAFSEFDRVLGGGFIKGEVILLGGEPGIGKTTLLLQMLNNVVLKKHHCVYISAEESYEQLSVHAKRLGLSSKLDIICEDDIDAVIAVLLDKKFVLVVVDSIQTIKTDDLKSLPGGVGQVKECTSRIVEFAKSTGAAVVLVGHITKGGDLAGPKIIEHLVDGVFYLEGDSTSNTRFLKGVKNRFGSTSEIGIFSLTNKGFSDANNPSEMFVLSREPRIGICRGVTFEGRRVILIEVQALITKSTFSMPQRVVSGISKSKVQMLCALLSKYTKANFLDKDVYINIANGIKTSDSSLDLSICIALLSSYFNKKVDPLKVAVGEVSLTGQVQPVYMLKEKLKVLGGLGYKDMILPKGVAGEIRQDDSKVLLDSISNLIDYL